MELAAHVDGDCGSALTSARLDQFSEMLALGRWDDAERLWAKIQSDPDELRDFEECNPGDLESRYERLKFLTEQQPAHEPAVPLDDISPTSRPRLRRNAQHLRGLWYMQRGELESS
jgi:hypothetical protein